MYLLDTSAWLVHLFGEPGVEQINQLFDESHSEISISVLSIPETFARLKSLGHKERWKEVWGRYEVLFDRIIPVDIEFAQKAIELRGTSTKRIPTVDSLIVSTAMVNKLTVVHRDAHIGEIPDSIVGQIKLLDK